MTIKVVMISRVRNYGWEDLSSESANFSSSSGQAYWMANQPRTEHARENPA